MVKSLKKIPDAYLSSPDGEERKVLESWKADRVFEQSIERRRESPFFVFFEGPPTANGKPGIHHVFARTIKDVFPRYQTMRGKRVVRKAGWDTHGLPVELEVEKKLGISGKREIESLKKTAEDSIAEFNRNCRESIFTYKKEWETLSDRIAFWLDYGDPYITCDNRYIESVWYLLSRFFAKGLLYEGHRVLPFCCRCGTTLSSHELGQPGAYRDVQDPSVFARFRLVGQEDTSFLAWTTTPWTLPSNFALALHPELDYVTVEHEGEKFILAAGRAKALLPDAKVLETKKGKDWVGVKYLPLFEKPARDFRLESGAWEPSEEHLFSTRPGTFVSSEEGTGIVHMAPYGGDDFDLARRDKLPLPISVGPDGVMKEIEEGFPAGLNFKEADKHVLKSLKQRKLLFKQQTIQHNYPFCWRCDTALMYFATPAWFIRTTEFKDLMIGLNGRIRWEPPEIGQKRFGEWLENNIDWTLSRDRYWGTPLPIWECGSCEERICVDSCKTLEKLSGKKAPEDLHRPYIDQVAFPCKKCKGEMKRVRFVIDCWFDSGAMPFAQYHWPHGEGSREKLLDQFPADFIAEGLDQTRGWFYTLHAIASFMTGIDSDSGIPIGDGNENPAYKACIVNGLLLDKEGRKMSKRLGNVVNPWEAIEKNGVDAIRWYLLSSSAPHLPKRFDAEALQDTRRRFFGTLANSVNFFVLYAGIDKYAPAAERTPLAERQDIDRWLMSRTHSLAREVGESLENYQIQGPMKKIERFVVDELSNWYIRRNRRRFWKSADDSDKRCAYDTLYESLSILTRLLAPFAPFFAEMIWQSLGEEGSVHLQDWPSGDTAAVDAGLEQDMASVLRVVEMGRVVRERAGIRTRQPLSLLRIHGTTLGDLHLRQIAEELNVEQAEAHAGGTDLFQLKAKPNYKVLGKIAGKKMKALSGQIAGLETAQIAELRGGGTVSVDAEGEPFELKPEYLTIVTEAPEGLAVESDGELSIILETEISEVLRLKGISREFVNRIQNLRKKSGFKVMDRIRIEVDGSGPQAILEAVRANQEYIAEETLASGGIAEGKAGSEGSELDLGEAGKISVRIDVVGG